MTEVIVPEGGQMHTTPEERERLKLYRRDYRAKAAGDSGHSQGRGALRHHGQN